MEYLVTVVTVVRNGEEHIEKTISSVITDKPNWLQYIVIDGASTDSTFALISKYRDSIDCIISEPDLGIYDAMNKGISLAQGMCIGLLNSGDLYVEGSLPLVASYAKGFDAKYWLLAGGVQSISSKGILGDIFVPDQSVLRNRYRMMPLNHPAMFVSRAVYSDYGKYNVHYKISSDYEFVLMVVANNIPIHFVDRVFVRMLSGGVSESLLSLPTMMSESYNIRRKYKGMAYCLLVAIRELASFMVNRLVRDKG